MEEAAGIGVLISIFFLTVKVSGIMKDLSWWLVFSPAVLGIVISLLLL
jgi:hypothetical protein